MRQCWRGGVGMIFVLNVTTFVWPFWPTGLLFFFSFIVSVFLNDLMCASGSGFCNKQASSSKGNEQSSGEPSKEIRGGSRSSTISKTSNDPPAQIAHLKLFSCFGPLSLLRWQYLEAQFSFCLQNQWRISHVTATSRARERVGEGIPRKLLYL
jgi:hypothetical protein